MIALLVSAGLMGIALQSASGHWLGWVALIPLFLSMRRLTPLRALLAGAFWGLSLFLVCLFSLNQPFAPTLQSFLLLIAVPAAYVWGGVMLTRRVGSSLIVEHADPQAARAASRVARRHPGPRARGADDGLPGRLVHGGVPRCLC